MVGFKVPGTRNSQHRPDGRAAISLLRAAVLFMLVLMVTVVLAHPQTAYAADHAATANVEQITLAISDQGVSIFAGETVTYTVTISNTSPTELLKAIELTVKVPGGVMVTGCSVNAPLSGACLIASDMTSGAVTLNEELGPAGASGLISGTVTFVGQTGITQATDLTVQALMSALNGADAPVTVGPISVTTPVYQPLLTTQVTADRSSVQPGDGLRYTITISNSAAVTATGVTAVLSLPPGVSPESISSAGGEVQSGRSSVAWPPVVLPGPGVMTRTVDAVVANPLAPAAGELTALLTATHASALLGSVADSQIGIPVLSGAISGHVWRDMDGSGTRSNDEQGLSGVTVILMSATTTVTTESAADGSYRVEGLRPDTYTVSIDGASLLWGLVPTYESDLVLDNAIERTVTAGTATADFGYAGLTGDVGGEIFLDRNDNGLLDAGDDGIEGVVVQAQGSGPDRQFNTADDLFVSDTTDLLGSFRFSALTPGRYRIHVDRASVPAGYLLRFDPDDEPNGVVSLTLVENAATTTLFFGYAALDLRISKSDDGFVATTGVIMPYRLYVENAGLVDAQRVDIVETVPEHTRFDSATSTPGWRCDGSGDAGEQCIYPLGALPAGAKQQLLFSVTVTDTMPAHTNLLTNTVQITDRHALAPDPTPQDNQAIVFTPVAAEPDLYIRQTDGGSRTEPGLTLVYTMTYGNQGNQHAAGVKITQVIPENTIFDPAASTPGWRCAPDLTAGSVCTYNVGAFNGGEERQIAFAMQIEPTMPVNVAAIDAQVVIQDDLGVRASDNELTPVDSMPDLQLTKTSFAGVVEPGTVIVFILDYINRGNQNAIGVLVVESVPAHTAFEPAFSSAGWSCQENGRAGDNCIFSIGGLAAGEGGRIEYAVRVDANLSPIVTSIGSTAVIAGSGVEQDILNNAAPGSVDVNRPTAVDLVSFDAIAHEPGLMLRWSTSAERNSWGFILYRSTDRSWERAIRITPQLIESTGSKTSGADYSFHDTSVVPSVPYMYWLQELELSGHTVIYGPISGLLEAEQPVDPTPTSGPGTEEPGNPDQTRVYLPLVLNR